MVTGIIYFLDVWLVNSDMAGYVYILTVLTDYVINKRIDPHRNNE